MHAIPNKNIHLSSKHPKTTFLFRSLRPEGSYISLLSCCFSWNFNILLANDSTECWLLKCVINCNFKITLHQFLINGCQSLSFTRSKTMQNTNIFANLSQNVNTSSVHLIITISTTKSRFLLSTANYSYSGNTKVNTPNQMICHFANKVQWTEPNGSL